MLRTVILVRHGKAVSYDAFKKDIDRVLAERGVNDGYKVASKLIQNGDVPDLILSSPAARASHTALIFARAMNIGSREVKMMDKFYHCSASTMLDALYELPDDIMTVVIAAHNPGITDLAYELTRGATNFLPTTGPAVIKYNAASWSEISSANPDDYYFIIPREI